MKKNKRIKIAVIGSHGVGKSTFSEELYEILKHNELYSKFVGKVKLLPEWAVPAGNIGFPINEYSTPETQLWIIMRQIEQEKYTRPTWITDKCLLDSLAYGLNIIKDEKYREIITDLVKRNAKYDYLFYLPIEFPIEDNGIRSLDPKFQKSIDNLILKIMKELNIKYYKLAGSKKNRLNRALKILNLN